MANAKSATATKAPQSLGLRAARIAWKTARALLIVYLGVLLLMYFSQTSLIFPGRMSKGAGYAKIPEVPATAELIDLKTSDGVPIKALFGRALASDKQVRPDAAKRPTIVFFYGNGAYLANYTGLLLDFQRMGANCLIAEYVGYGLSGGSPSEQGCYATADAGYEWLAARPDVDVSKLIFVGQSLGGGPATELAIRHPPAGLVLLTAFTSVTEMARLHYPFLPVSWLLTHRFDNRDKIAQVRCPILISHGMQDEIVPYAMSLELKAAAGGPVTHLPVSGAMHNDFLNVGFRPVMAAIQKMIDDVAAR